MRVNEDTLLNVVICVIGMVAIIGAALITQITLLLTGW